MDLNILWFILLGVLLAGYSLLDGFDLGVGILHLFVAPNDHDRRIVMNSIGPVWDGNEVWLITLGGALFAAFPIAYATVFSGFYLAMMLVLFGLILRAVSMEFRSKVEFLPWRWFFDWTFSFGSFLTTLLFGVAAGNLMIGLPLDARLEYDGGFFTLLRPFPILAGLFVVVLFALHGANYLRVKTEGDIQQRAIVCSRILSGLGIVLFVLVFGWCLIAKTPVQPGWQWFVAMVLGGFSLVFTLIASRRERETVPLLGSSLSILLLAVALACWMFPNLVHALDPNNHITIRNAASSNKTLMIMAIIAGCALPVVLVYTFVIYRTFRGKVRLEETSY